MAFRSRSRLCVFVRQARACPFESQQGVLPVPARPPHPNTCPVVGLLSNPAKPRRAGHTKPHGTGILDLATTDATVVAPSPAPSIGSSEHPLGGATTLDTLTTHTRRRRAGDGAPQLCALQTRVQSKIHGNSEKELNEWLSEKILQGTFRGRDFPHGALRQPRGGLSDHEVCMY